MTERQPLLLYVPLLHKELVDESGISHCAKAPICTLWPGLPPASSSLSDTPDNQYRPAYPYSPVQALSCLNDWKALAAEQGPDALTLPRNVPGWQDKPLDSVEELALEAFSRTGSTASADTAPPISPVLPKTVQPHTEAQQRLLMVWLQEEHVIDIKKLIKQYHLNAAALAATLTDAPLEPAALSASPAPLSGEMTGDVSEKLTEALLPQGLLPDDASALLPPWNFVLENMAPFLPDNCILYSADLRMWESLQERGIRFEPLPPAEGLPQPQPDASASPGVVRQHLTLLEMLGKKKAVPEAPWLNVRHELRFVLVPSLLPTP